MMRSTTTTKTTSKASWGDARQHRSLTNLLFDKENKEKKLDKYINVPSPSPSNKNPIMKPVGGWFVTLDRTRRLISHVDESPYPSCDSAVCFWLDGSPYRRRVGVM